MTKKARNIALIILVIAICAITIGYMKTNSDSDYSDFDSAITEDENMSSDIVVDYLNEDISYESYDGEFAPNNLGGGYLDLYEQNVGGLGNE